MRTSVHGVEATSIKTRIKLYENFVTVEIEFLSKNNTDVDEHSLFIKSDDVESLLPILLDKFPLSSIIDQRK